MSDVRSYACNTSRLKSTMVRVSSDVVRDTTELDDRGTYSL